jgi:hypothetical protein
VAKRKRARKPAAPAKFKVGDKVRVKYGVKDVDSDQLGTLPCNMDGIAGGNRQVAWWMSRWGMALAKESFVSVTPLWTSTAYWYALPAQPSGSD